MEYTLIPLSRLGGKPSLHLETTAVTGGLDANAASELRNQQEIDMRAVNHALRHNFEIIVVSCIVLLVLGSVLFFTQPGRNDAPNEVFGAQPTAPIAEPTAVQPTPNEVPQTPYTIPHGLFPGGSAIQVLHKNVSEGPNFGLEEVRAYVSDAYPGSEIVELEFMEAADVEARYETGQGFFGGRLLAVVTLSGEFPISVPPEVPPQTSKVMVTIFDARTGNELMRTYVP